MHQLTLEILGSRFTIKSDENPEHLEAVAEYLKLRIEEAKTSYPSADPFKVLILASLNIADSYIKLQEAGGEGEIQQITEHLILKLDQNLEDN
ncbi:MAG: cell division protein ZapA [Spirochaetales bacterium]|nr:cell division protein ZapA [Spirochaetales bacterium]RKX86583.1 MAG: hypothetical protein DRP57_01225 [Spirochaetota bacterium]